MKSLIKIVICISLGLPARSWGNEYLAPADNAVKEARERADAQVKFMVERNFRIALEKLQINLARVEEAKRQITIYLSSLTEMEESLNRFSRLDAKSLAQSGEAIQKAIKDYEVLYTKLLDLSFKPSELQMELQNIEGAMVNLLNHFRYECETGVADMSFDSSLPIAPPPPTYHAFTELFVSTDPGQNSVQHQSLNYEDKGTNDFIKYGGSASGLALSVGLASTGVLASAALATGGIGLVVVAVVALVSYLSSSRKAYKQMRKYIDAENHKFINTPRADYIAKGYKQSCKEHLATLEEISQVVGQATSMDNNVRDLLSRKNKSGRDRVEATRKEAQRIQENFCKIEILRGYKLNKCVGENSICEIKDNIAFRKNGNCAVKIADVTEEKLIQDLIKENNAKTTDTTLNSRMIEMVKYDIGEFLLTERQKISKSINSISWAEALQSQARALRTLIKIVHVGQINRDLQDPQVQKLMADLQIDNTVNSLHSQFMDVIAHAIKAIFEPKHRPAYDAAVSKWRLDYMNVRSNYPYVSSILNMDNGLKQLEHLMKDSQ